MTPPTPTATNFPADQVTAERDFVVPEVRDVHVTPSGEERITPRFTPCPTATNAVPDPATPLRLTGAPPSENPASRVVHVMPSGDVRMVPFVPTATNCVPDQVTPTMESAELGLREVQVIPSGEV
jgi:hypothetical protein